MEWVRVAAASAYGLDVDQSLQEASRFHIYDVDPEEVRLVEVRPAGGPSADLAVEELLETLSDCSMLLVREIGGAPGGKLGLGWVTVYEAPMPVQKALRKFSQSPLFRRKAGM